MSSPFFCHIRKSSLATTLIAGMLSNIVVFAEPVSRTANHYVSGDHNDKHIINGSLPQKKVIAFPQNMVAPKTFPEEKTSGADVIKKNNVPLAATEKSTWRSANNPPIEKALIFSATEQQGAIGITETYRSDNGKDNYFTVSIPSNVDLSQYTPVLSYDLHGLKNFLATTKSINGSAAYGGKHLEKDDLWKKVEEYLPQEYLRSGTNEIFFNRRNNEEYGYHIKNVAIKLYLISGNELKDSESAIKHILEEDRQLQGTEINFKVPLENSLRNFGALSLTPLLTDSVAMGGNATVWGLPFKDVKPLNQELINVTHGNYEGYRIKLSNLETVALDLQLGYDESKIPEGYTPKDIRTFYYDKLDRNWKSLPLDKVNSTTSSISSILSEDPGGETDYINGIIKIPEQPETANFVPTAIKDMEFANPTAGVISIPPPSPNSMGSVSTSFPIKLPPGRNGLQPSLTVAYNSDGGNGWMGMGWDITVPSISINTKWGVPRFETNGSIEMQLYSLAGQDLVLKKNGEYTAPHRDGDITRETNRQFYLRKEGSYLEIIRHGNSPKNYYWEVTDKVGNKEFYGGIGSLENKYVIKDTEGNIIHWALARQQDPYGNYIQYNYNNQAVTVNGITGREFYIESIDYTLHNQVADAYYKVVFSRNSNRNDIITTARCGIFQITKDLLESIKVTFENHGTAEPIRTYLFEYADAPFLKKHLEKISELDNLGNLFYTNTMEYYDEVSNVDIISFDQSLWDGENDLMFSPLHDLAPSAFSNLLSKGSALGASSSNGYNFGLRGGVGLGFVSTSAGLSVGGSYNYSQDTQNTRITFIDINGDGLPDKVYSGRGSLSYRPNTGSGFGNLIPISGLNGLTKTKSRTNGFGFDANASLGPASIGVGWSKSKTKTTTDNYFVDFNGDGLPDVVSNNRVRFNTTQGNSDYTWRNFDPNGVNASENPIVSGTMDPDIIDDLVLETMDELRSQHPQYDHVKVWQAPYSGQVAISNQARIISLNNDGSHVNPGFRLTIEKRNKSQKTGLAQPVGDSIIISSASTTYNSFSRGVTVSKGDQLFFRLHNRGYGYGGEVEWNPIVTYTSKQKFPNVNEPDENGKSFKVFNSQEDYILDDGGSWRPENGDSNITINFNLLDQDFLPYQFSDDMTFVVQKMAIDNSSGLVYTVDTWKRTYRHHTGTFDPTGDQNSVNTNIAPSANTTYQLSFYAHSTSNLDWDRVQWKPTIIGAGNVYHPSVSYRKYDDNINEVKYWVNGGVLPVVDSIPNGHENQPLVGIHHNLFASPPPTNFPNFLSQFLTTMKDNGELPLKINWVVKEKSGNLTKVLNSRTFYLIEDNGYKFSKTSTSYTSIISDDYEFFLTKEQVQNIGANNGVLYAAFYVDNKNIAVFDQTQITFETIPNEQLNYPMVPQIINAPFMARSSAFFGSPYRGWGQFLYNSGLAPIYDNEGEISGFDSFFGPIDVGILNNEIDIENPGDVQDLEDQIGETNPQNVGNINSSGVLRCTYYNQNNANMRYENSGILDAVYGLNTNNELTATTGRFGLANLYEIYVDPSDLLNGNGTYFLGLQQRSQSKGSALSENAGAGGLGFSGTNSESHSKLLNQYIDLNGDAYPDIVTENRIQYSQMIGGFSSTSLPNTFVSGSQNKDFTSGANIAGMFPNSTQSSNNKSIGNKTITNTQSGINSSDGTSFDALQWADMNGDGLPDKVWLLKSSVEVALNNGYGFTNTPLVWGSNYGSSLINSSRSSLSGGPSLNFGTSFAAGFGLAKSTANMDATLVDVNGDGLPDLVVKQSGLYEYYLNTGTSFLKTSSTFTSSSTIEEDKSSSGNVFASATWGPVFSIYLITIKIPITLSAGASANFSEKTATIADINGDGLPDVLYKSNNNGSVSARLNRVGKTHLLKKVNTPLGGSWEVAYEQMGNTYSMPQKKWVMKEVKTHDGFTGDNTFGLDETLTKISYENGYKDRRERDFYGFETVKIEQQNPADGSTYRYTEQKYHNNNYYLKGVLKQTATYSGKDELLSLKRNFYNLVEPEQPFSSTVNTDLDDPYTEPGIGEMDRTRIFTALVKTIATSFEDGQALNLVQEFSEYDKWGNITTYINHGSGVQDAYRTEIEYDTGSQFPGLPINLEVYKNAGGTSALRHREAQYNSFGKLQRIITHLNANDTNTVEWEYDGLGNTIEIHQMDNTPLNGSGHYTININYDDVLFSYPTEINDSFGQTSTSVYNYFFGIPVFTTDVNDNSMRTRIDNRGRVIEIAGPNEYTPSPQNGTDWIIRMEYEGEDPVEQQITGAAPNDYMFSKAQNSFLAAAPNGTTPVTTAQHYALTRHRDPLNASNEFHTVSIVDGFGQAIQLKKTHFLNGSTLVWQVSGKEKKDPFGRVIEKYLPRDQAIDAWTNFTYSNSVGIGPTFITYDERDRQTQIQQPGTQATTDIFYSIDSGMFLTTVINELQQTQETYTDLRGRQRKIIQNGEITTEFFYNAINEKIKTKAHQGYETKYFYDMAGRRTKEEHPDRGTTLFGYDNAGRLISKQTANMMQLNTTTGTIGYEYDYGRLVKITYPGNPENDVTYEYGTSTAQNKLNNVVGRLTRQEDATGIQTFGYGKMGELSGTLRAIAVAGKMSYWFSTQWEYDSWNRAKSITYPDKEKITYHYDPAGQLKSVTSDINIGPTGASTLVTDIKYTLYGERSQIEYGNGTVTNYDYDLRRRLNQLEFVFPSFGATRSYGYDDLSNIVSITSSNVTNPNTGVLGGPITHTYDYDNYNRLIHANGYYVGPNDSIPDLLGQAYALDMVYDKAHNILEKHQVHQFGSVPSVTVPLSSHALHNPKTSYKLEYSGYATATHTAAGQGYVQPHAPRKIIEYPNENFNGDPEDPRIRHNTIDYDANGNQLQITRRISDPEQPLGHREETLRRNLWDSEDRLRAVDLNPEADTDKPLVAAYTYDAAGERTIKYVPGRFDARYSAKETGNTERLEAMLYPSPLLTVKTLPIPEGVSREELERLALTKYTNHYYIGSERIASALGTLTQLGILCEQTGDPGQAMINRMDDKVDEAGNALNQDHERLGKTLVLPPSFHYNGQRLLCELTVYPEMYAAFWYHPDHLGSSSYITNLDGEITQHMEYLPFGETLVEEHLNSNNSPYKFNAKELDEETGNYYYGARYYDPKWSIWLSVDPLAEVQPNKTPYHYCSNNPISRVDPTGMLDGDFIDENGKYLGNDGIDDGKVYVVKTTEKSFDSGVSSAGISKSDAKATANFIKKNSGNTEAFQNNSIAYDNSVEIVGDQSVRQGMVDIVNQDNGRGGTSDANNREYGGVLRNGKVVESPMGPVGNPKTDLSAHITHPDVRNGDITFHSHPSGQIIEGSGSGQGTTIGGSTTTYQWGRAPSAHDVKGASGNEYVFSRGNGTVYIYNRNGVVATIPQNRFVTPKK